MKRCGTCKESKPLDQFNKRTGSKDGRQHECRTCAHVRLKTDYDSLTPEQKKSRFERQKSHRHRNPDKYYWHRIKAVYSLTEEAFDVILNQQDGKCAICKTANPGGRSGRWNVDHDHSCCPGDKSCGKCVRGLLCTHCNHGLGSFRDSIESLKSAVTYLVSTP